MTRDPSALTKQLRDLSEQDFRSFVEKVMNSMGLATKGFRSSGDTMEMEAVLSPGGEKYIVFATREVEAARPHDIQKAVERMRKSGVPRGIFITTGTVSKDAESYASQFDVAVADAERFGQLMDKFGLSEELDRRSTQTFLERDGDRHLPSMGQLDSTMKWGYDFFESGNYRKALEYFVKAAELKPDYDVPHAMVGNCHSALGDHAQAVDAYEEALRRNPSSEESWFNLGSALYALGKHEDELACYDKALELNRGYERAWNNKGVTLLELGKDEEAVLCFDQALKSNPRNERALSNRGVALKHLDRRDEALASFDRALAVKGDDLDTWLNRGLLLQGMERHLEAVKSYDRVLERFKTPELQAQKASALIASGLHKAALDALDHALSMKPGWDVAIELRAKAEEALRQDIEAKSRLQAPERIVPTKPIAEPASPAIEVSEPDIPAPEYTAATDPQERITDRSEDSVLFTCSECGSEVGEKDNFCIQCGSDLRDEEDSAEPDFEPELPAGEPEEVERIESIRAEEKEELEFDEIVGLGEACMRLGMFEDAIGRFGEAALLRSDARLHRMQGEAAYSLGHFDDAAGFFEEALDMEPSDDHAAWSRVEALLKGGRHAAANEALEALAGRVDPSVSAFLLKADILDSWGRGGKALDEAAVLANWSADLWNLTGVAMASAGKTDDALICLDRAVQSDPSHWEAWCGRGAVLAGAGELEQALKSFDRALDERPDAPAALAGKASILARQGRHDEALELLDEAAISAQSPDIFAIRSFILLESDDLDGAVGAADEGLAIDQESPELWNMKGLAQKRAGKTAAAIASFEEALSHAPDFPDAVKNLEGIEREIGKGKELAKPAGRQVEAKKALPQKAPPAAVKRDKRPSGVLCQECGEENDIGAKKCASCGSRLKYKDKEDALAREMEDAISGDAGVPKKRGGKKVAKHDRESFIRELMSVPGIGYSKASDIWEAGFRSADDVHRAEMAELTRISGISPALARKLKKGI